MSIQLSPSERDCLQRLVDRPMRPTRRQKALALLVLAEGGTREKASQRAGISKEAVAELETAFRKQGLDGVGLLKPRDTVVRKAKHVHEPAVVKTRGVCGGAARRDGTRIPVWQLVEARQMGASDVQLLRDYPALRAGDLAEAWKYADKHQKEIAAEIRKNEVA